MMPTLLLLRVLRPDLLAMLASLGLVVLATICGLVRLVGGHLLFDNTQKQGFFTCATINFGQLIQAGEICSRFLSQLVTNKQYKLSIQ